MMEIQNGSRFGRWLVIDAAGATKHRIICKCECGTERDVNAHHILAGRTRSCGCAAAEARLRSVVKHGQSTTPTYRSWSSMLGRCYDPRNASFEAYGASGISVCDRWRSSFENFLKDMGPRPSGKTLDRVDSDLGYFPDNCRWATGIEQQANRKNTKFLTALGQTLTFAEWTRRAGISHQTINGRLARGWSTDDAVSTPLNTRKLMKAFLQIEVETVS